MDPSDLDVCHMARALELAQRGRGSVEPNPMVGCVIVSDGEVVGEGWHQRFGGPHAEIEALRIAGGRAASSTMYVTLEPCCHHGKTPPCTQSIVRAGIRRVLIAMADPFSEVAGRGIAELKAAGIVVEVGLLEAESRRLNAPYLKLLATGRPFVIAKWAMTLDGKIATRSGDSRWISGEASREIVHALRGRADAILIGRGTALADDPLLTARPSGPRTATRIVLDTNAALSPESQLGRTARLAPVLVAVGTDAPAENQQRLADAGCDLVVCAGSNPAARLDWLLLELGRRRMTNVLVEGGAELLGSLFDARAVDEVHVFVAPKIVGGNDAPSAAAGVGLARMADALALDQLERRFSGPDLYVSGRVRHPA